MERFKRLQWLLTHAGTDNAAGEFTGHISHLMLGQVLGEGVGIGVILHQSARGFLINV